MANLLNIVKSVGDLQKSLNITFQMKMSQRKCTRTIGIFGICLIKLYIFCLQIDQSKCLSGMSNFNIFE